LLARRPALRARRSEPSTTRIRPAAIATTVTIIDHDTRKPGVSPLTSITAPSKGDDSAIVMFTEIAMRKALKARR